ncbi:hypothetical protein V8V91_00780 [Algoriphagus halophilus]|uniref:hypothetical protein n=1 Tax=Algoriphagus halophilus TaxID=226505 RepID=UPI00358E2138
MKSKVLRLSVVLCLLTSSVVFAQNQILITNAKIFDGTNKLVEGKDVLIQGNKIVQIAEGIMITLDENSQIIDAAGKTLIPGLTDAHWHTMHAHIASMQIFVNDIGYLTLVGAEAAEAALMRVLHRSAM